MTQKILKTHIEEILKVKLACKCGFSAEYPVSATSVMLENCPVCGKKTPINSFVAFLKATYAIQEAMKNFPDYQVQIETKETL